MRGREKTHLLMGKSGGFVHYAGKYGILKSIDGNYTYETVSGMIICITKPTGEKAEAVTQLCSKIVVLIKLEANGKAGKGKYTLCTKIQLQLLLFCWRRICCNIN